MSSTTTFPTWPRTTCTASDERGRAGEQGYAISFVSPNSRKLPERDRGELIGREIPVMTLETYEINPDLLKKGAKKRREREETRQANSDDRAARYKQRREDEHKERKHRKGEKKHRDDKHGGSGRNAEERRSQAPGQASYANALDDRKGGKRGRRARRASRARWQKIRQRLAKTSYRSKHGADHRGRKASGNDAYAAKAAKTPKARSLASAR